MSSVEAMEPKAKLPTLSVMLPNYNHARYLPQCLDSLLAQTLKPIEIIIIDDGSTDDSIEVLERYAKTHPIIKVYKNEKNMGTIYTCNRGMQLARGEYLFLFAADEWLLPTYNEMALTLLTANPQAGMCFSDPASVDHETGDVNENRLRLSDRPCFLTPDELVKLARRKRVLIQGSAMFKLSVLHEMGGYQKEFRWHADFFIGYVISFRQGACYLPEALTRWRATPGSFMSSGLKRWPEQRHLICDMLELLNTPAYADVLRRFQKSGVMAFVPRAWVIILQNRKYWPFLNFPLLRWTVLMDVFWLLPHWLQRILRRMMSR